MNDLLLDTHVFLWWLDGDDRLQPGVRDTIESAERVAVSDASLWELAVKVSVGKFRVNPDVRTWFERHLAAERFAGLAIDRPHAARVANLPLHHRDPFDRMLIAQAQVEALHVVTRDPAFARYDVETIW